MPVGVYPRKKVSPESRLWARVDKNGPNGCWLWKGATIPFGYGVFGINRKTYLVHRYSWSLANGPIPTGLFVCHKCDVPACVNPEHLFIGTQKDNLRDMSSKGRSGTQRHPETIACGDAHHARRMPECLARGERHGSNLHPERRPKGESHGCSKLKESDIPTIRKLLAAGHSQRKIGAMYGLSQGSIAGIAQGRLWKHVA